MITQVHLKFLRRALTGLFIFIFLPVLAFYLANFFFPFAPQCEYSKIVLDQKGQIIHGYLNSNDKWRMKVKLEELSPDVITAFINKEDKYFYNHPGVNPLAIVRALTNNILRQKKTSGASTITMQVVRMLQPKKRTYLNKITEIFRALQLEINFSKKEIFEMYLSLVPYGGNIEGVKSASLFFFGKSPRQLSIGETTVLTIVPNRPNSLSLTKSKPILLSERNRWLKYFEKEHLFTKSQISDALQEPLSIGYFPINKIAPHLSNRLKNENNMTELHTYIDAQSQRKVAEILKNYSQRLVSVGIYNGAILVVDNTDASVKVYVGSQDFNDPVHGGQVDGIPAVRSPGSTLKPLLYGHAFDKGIITPKMVVNDVPFEVDGYQPENFDKKYNGPVTIETALAYSLNVPAVKILDEMGVQDFVTCLKQFDFKQIAKDQAKLGHSVILGGCGCSLQELTASFCALANEGQYRPLKFMQNEPKPMARQIISKEASFIITQNLTAITRPDLPNNFESTYHVPRIAWKTGTSYGRRDAWAIGYNKSFTVGVWLGNFTNEAVPELVGMEVATPLLFEVFNTVDYNSHVTWYKKPKDLKFRIVCEESGLPPSSLCTKMITDYFMPTVSSNHLCEHKKELLISPDEKYSYCLNCTPQTGYKKKVFDNLSPELITFYIENQIPFKKIPEHNPSCTRLIDLNKLKITSPLGGKEYYLEKGDSPQIQLACQAHNDVNLVYWYINDKFYKRMSPSSKIFFSPSQGKTKISCADDKGRSQDVFIDVMYY